MPPVPERFPIFPLPDVVLFPDVRLPLHIFEPRYREMTRDALAGEGKIGMVLIEPGEGDPSQVRAPVFATGCLGRITEHQELEDGRFLVVLQGERRFRILQEEDGDLGYRVVQAELLEDPAFDALDAVERASLELERVELERRMLELINAREPAAARLLEERMQALDPIELLHALAFGIDRPVLEKQSLLEAPDPLTRAHLLRGLFEFREAESQLSFAPKNVN
jgi:Lon protease-like protein